MSRSKSVVCVVDDNSGCEAIYVGGKLEYQSDTIYLSELCEAAGSGPVRLEQLTVELAVGADFPQLLATVRKLKKTTWVKS